MNDGLKQLAPIRHVSDSQRETVIRETIKDLLRTQGKQQDLVFLAELPLKTATKTTLRGERMIVFKIATNEAKLGT